MSCLNLSLLLLLNLMLMLPAATRAADSTLLSTRGSAGTPATLELHDSPLRVMTATPMRLQLHPDTPWPQAQTTVSCDLTMPAMPMPPNRPLLSRQGEAFFGEAIFTMAGGWQADCILALPAGGEEHFRFAIEQVLLQ